VTSPCNNSLAVSASNLSGVVMKVLHLVSSIVTIVALASTSANACEVNRTPAERIGQSITGTVVLGSVIQASYTTRFRVGAARPWAGIVQAKRVLRGQTRTVRFSIGRTGNAVACDDGMPPPKQGDLWVLYIWKENGKEIVGLSYPLSVARSADPSISSAINLK
jgi:hypothetical protein